MKIIILGAGRIGESVAATLVSERNDITVIDSNAQRLRELEERFELRGVLEGGDLGAALSRYHAFSASHRCKFESMYRVQQSIRHLHGRPIAALAGLFGRSRPAHWAFGHYLDIAPPSFALPAPPEAARAAAPLAA